MDERTCCPKFDPEPWNEKTQTFTNKLFIKDHVTSFFHIPLNYGAVMTRNMAKIDAANTQTTSRIILTDECSLWRADVYIETSQPVNDCETTTLSGTFLSKVFEGPYRDIGKWIKEMNAYVTAQGKTSQKLYFYYTTCPKCAKKYGKNYVVLLAQV